MGTSRRDFVKATLAAGVGIASAGGEAQVHTHSPAAASTNEVVSSEFTRGVGVYPGASDENFSPTLVQAGAEYRNLALLRPAFHSSSYDYNLTAQLVTDGITHNRLPTWVSVSVDGRVLPKPDRETMLNHFRASVVEVVGARPVIEFYLGGGVSAPEIDEIVALVTVPHRTDLKSLQFSASNSSDGYMWAPLGSTHAPKPLDGEMFPPDLVHESTLLLPRIKFEAGQRTRFYRFQMEILKADSEEFSSPWGLGQIEFYHRGIRVNVGGPYSFTSAWKAAGLGEEWVYVDLGAVCTLDRVALHWIASARAGKIQVSNDAVQWRDVATIHGATSKEEIALQPNARARYVRALMTRPSSAEGYVLSELEVLGRGGLVPKAKSSPSADHNGNLHLAGGRWRVLRADQTTSAGEALSQPGVKDGSWLVATVPGTVLTSYLNAGAVPNPDFGDNQLFISDSYFYSDFWYRTEFVAPQAASDQMQWLHFAGINWKANIFLNGERLGRIEGAFQRAKYDVTKKLKAGQVNALAVLIEKNATPGSAKQKTFEVASRNGGALGADNPTFHASVGWDWISTIRDRNIGIWDSVSLVTTSVVTIADPFVTSELPLPDTSRARVKISAHLTNHANAPQTGMLECRFGEAVITQAVTLANGEEKTITLSPESHPELVVQAPKLWWPAGYGEPHLYDVELTFRPQSGRASESLEFKAGIRQITASEEGGALKLWVNGRRLVVKGGNWGFSESMLRYRAREYDAAVRYHREMNFNMIRNWVGQIGEDAFYEACDRHGVLVWQDFWLANPWDGPIPDDNEMFLKNARVLLLRTRQHACLGIYCGRNEWYPPKPIDDGIRALLKELHPDLPYIGSSADGPVSGHGPYKALPPETYFRIADAKLHSEIGCPNIPSLESVKLMMPQASQWPQALDWGLHDFCLKGAQGGESFRSIIEESYGGANNAEEWIRLAQFVNYDTYRAMFESQGKYRMGLLLWMSHSCWPSFVWQTYDYYLEPTAAYFACKSACEPIHIQHNPVTEQVEVVNVSAGNLQGLRAHLRILNLKGEVLANQAATLDSREDSTVEAFAIHYPAGLPDVHFVRLSLSQGSKDVSKNFYVRGLRIGDFRGLRSLPAVRLAVNTEIIRQGEAWKLTTKLRNTSSVPALMVRAGVVRMQSRDRILPAIFSDNYFALMPGEEEILTAEVQHSDTRGEKPQVVIDGFNVT